MQHRMEILISPGQFLGITLTCRVCLRDTLCDLRPPSKKDRLVDEKNVRSAKTEGAIHVKSLREQRKEVKRELTELDEAVTLQGIGIDMGTEGIKPADVSMDEAHKLAVSFNLEL